MMTTDLKKVNTHKLMNFFLQERK